MCCFLFCLVWLFDFVVVITFVCVYGMCLMCYLLLFNVLLCRIAYYVVMCWRRSVLFWSLTKKLIIIYDGVVWWSCYDVCVMRCIAFFDVVMYMSLFWCACMCFFVVCRFDRVRLIGLRRCVFYDCLDVFMCVFTVLLFINLCLFMFVCMSHLWLYDFLWLFNIPYFMSSVDCLICLLMFLCVLFFNCLSFFWCDLNRCITCCGGVCWCCCVVVFVLFYFGCFDFCCLHAVDNILFVLCYSLCCVWLLIYSYLFSCIVSFIVIGMHLLLLLFRELCVLYCVVLFYLFVLICCVL